ncbi:MAG: hypothetical protein K8R69_10140 [Deltaproteobacteria bacterium]|nr:hypothetical protein [Deltaproteobacteria bacterium]
MNKNLGVIRVILSSCIVGLIGFGCSSGSAPNTCTNLDPANPSGNSVEIFDSFNVAGVVNGGNQPTFGIAVPTVITSMATYHFNNGQGVNPGMLGFLDALNDQLFCPFQATTDAAQGQPALNWIATPNVTLQPGVYQVTDSDSSTWSSNSESEGFGFTRVNGIPDLPPGGGTTPVVLIDPRMGEPSCLLGGSEAQAVDFFLTSNNKSITLAAFVDNDASRPALKLTAVPNGVLLDTQTASDNQVTSVVNIPADVDISKPLTLTVSECGQVQSLDTTSLATQVFE